MLVTKGTLQSLHVAYSALFGKGLETASSEYRSIAEEVQCGTKVLEMSWLTQIPQIELSVGPNVYKDAVQSPYTISHHAYKSLMQVDVDDVEDDNIGTHNMLAAGHGKEAGNWVGNATMTLLPRGLTAKGFDGVSFFSASHPLHSGSTYSNFATDSGAPWYLLDTKRGVKPLIVSRRKQFGMVMQNALTDDANFDDDKLRWKIRGRYGFGYGFPQTAYCSKKTLNEANLELAITAMRNLTREDGQKINIQPDTLVVGPSNEFAAEKLMKAILRNDTVASSNIHVGRFNLIVSPFVESVSITLG